MSIRLLPLLVALGIAVPAAAQNAPDGYGQGGYPVAGYDTDGQSVDSIAVFFEPLSHYGRWLDSRYGRVWAPNVGRDWRPYTIGHWEDGPYGQTWRSDEPFGWAVFHFGRWAFDPAIGWVWAPDTVWGPGWVAWRDSDDVTGWAPLPPQVGVGLAFGSGYGFNDWGYDQWYQPAWVYVPRGYLYSRSLRGAFLPAGRNRDFWDRTRGVTRYDRVDGQVVNRSFGFRGGDGRDGGHDGFRDGGRRDGRGNDPRPAYDARDPRRDPRGVNDGRDWRGGQPLNGGIGRGYVPQSPSAVPPATGGGAPRGFGGRDGFVPGTMPPRGVDRRAAPPGVPPVRNAAPAPLAVTPPRQPSPAPVAPAPRAETPRPAPAPRPRETNRDERPR